MNLARQIETACLLEAKAPKPGNVHPSASFVDLRYEDFVRAAHAIAQPLAAAQATGVGRSILNAVKATRDATGTNVNLGIVLLLAPLAAVPNENPLQAGIQTVLDQMTVEDTEQVYASIRVASPGGLGTASSQDVADRPTVTLKTAMCLAADRDRIAEQYANGYQLVFEARGRLCELFEQCRDWNVAIVHLHLWMMSKWPDTLIARKCGLDIANEATRRAGSVIEQAGPDGVIDASLLDQFDRWLRADGHRRNPGTTADLIAATLFATFRDQMIGLPLSNEGARQ